MLGGFLDGCIPTQGTHRVYQHFGAKRTTTFLTLIAIGVVITTNRASSFNVSICQKSIRGFIIVLLRFFYFQIAIIIQYRKEFLCSFMM